MCHGPAQKSWEQRRVSSEAYGGARYELDRDCALKQFGSDVTKVPLTADLLQAVKFHKVYTERLAVEKQDYERQKGKNREESTKRALQEEERQLEQRIICSQIMLEHAQSLCREKKKMEKIKPEQVLLAETNAKLAQNLEKMKCTCEQLTKSQ